MKKILICLLVAGSAIPGFSQTFQATIKPGSLPNSVIFAIKPSASVTNAKITTLYFAIAIPSTTAPRPTIGIQNNFNPALSYTIETVPAPEMVGGTLSYIYNFLADGSTAAGVEKNYDNTIDNNILEFKFLGGPPVPSPATIRVVSLANGGNSFNTFFNIYNLGTDVTNTAAMFYGGAPVNSAAGYAGTSYTSLSNVVLPIKFLGLTAVKRDDNAVLNWLIENETAQTDRYEVERSLNGTDFLKINTVAPKNNGSSGNSYDLTDYHITSVRATGVIYYRIKQFDRDGRFIYSPVASVRLDQKGTFGLYPNPARDFTSLSFDLADAADVLINISEASGKQVQKIEFKGGQGANVKKIDLSGLASGSYLIKVSAGDQVQTLSLIKGK